MPIPDFQSVFLPLIQWAGDKQEHTNREAVEAMTEHFALTDEERGKMLPSGKVTYIQNRTGWAKTYLKKAGLLKYTGLGVFTITEKGLALLENPPEKLNLKYLKSRYEEFGKFHGIKSVSQSNEKQLENDAQTEIEERTPEELIATGYESIRTTLVSDLLDIIQSMTPGFFERLVVDLLLKMGYGDDEDRSGLVLGGSGDEGIDGVISEDKLGLDMIYIQAKKWEDGNSVSRPEIQKFVGALQGKQAKKGVFITTSTFTKGAIEYASMVDTRVILIDGQKLANLMIDHDVGVSLKDSYLIKKIDSDYFEDE